MARKAKKKEKDFKQEKFEFEEEKNSKEDEIEEIEEDIDKLEDDIDEDSEDDNEEFEDEEDEDEEDDEDSEDDDEVNPNPIKNTMSDKTRYILIAVSSVLLVGLIVCMAIFGSNDIEKNGASIKKAASVSKEERNTSTDFLKEFYKQMDSKEKNIIFFASATCGYCSLEKPIIQNIAKDYNLEYYDIDASTLNQTELSEVVKALGIRGATPTTVIVQDGKVLSYNEGYLDGKPFVEFFVKNEILSSDATYKQEDKLVSISYSEFKDKAKQDKKTVFLIDQSAFQECITARSVLNKIAAKNDFKIYYLSASNMTQDEINSLVNDDLKDMGYDEESYKSKKAVKIPLLLVVKKNKIKDYVVESSSEKDFTKVLNKHDFIK